MRTLLLSREQWNQIAREGEAAYPNECCGAMIGRDEKEQRTVEKLVPLVNSFEPGEQYHRFRLDPLELAKVEKQAGTEGKLVLGFYHSHPDHPARPSETDRMYAWPFYSYVIIAIAKRKAADLTSWQLDEQTEQFVSENVKQYDSE